MRIAFHADGHTAGGLARFILLLGSELADAGHDIVVILSQPGPFEDKVSMFECIVLNVPGVCNSGISIGRIQIPDPRHAVKNLVSSYWFTKQITDSLIKANLDLVIGVGMVTPALLATACRKTNTKLVTCVHGIGNRDNDFLSLRARVSANLLNKTELVVGVSNACLERYTPYLRVATKTIYHAVQKFETNPKLRAEFIRSQGLSSDVKIVGGFGRIQHDKGHHILAAAIALLADSHPDIVLVFGGSPLNDIESKYLAELRQTVDQVGLQKRCFFVGHVTPQHFFSIADIFCHTYLGYEALSFAILEAITAGCPTVAVNRGGPREIISDGKTGQLVEPNDPKALSLAISKYLDNPDFTNSVVEQASKLVVDSNLFDPNNWGHRWLDLIHEVCPTEESTIH